MKTFKIYFLIGLATLLFASCETEIKFNGDETASMMVVNSLFSPDSTIKVHISKSKFFLKDDSSFDNIINADVLLYVNDTLYEQLSHTGNGFYTGNYQPKPGDKVKLTAGNSEFATVNGITDIPNLVPVISIDTSTLASETQPIVNYSSYNGGPMQADTIGFNEMLEMKMNLNFSDPANQKNFYRVVIKLRQYYDDGKVSERKFYYNSDDMVFGSTSESSIIDEGSSQSQYKEFSDETLNGKNYTFKLGTSFNKTTYKDEYKPDPDNGGVTTISVIKNELVVELQSLSKSYYYYLKTRAAGATVIDFFSEPVQIYSNIEGGIGILGSYTISSKTIEIPVSYLDSGFYGGYGY